MKVFLKSESAVECTIDGVGLLEPGQTVEVDLDQFEMYHHKTPAQANFPDFIKVSYDTDRETAPVEPASTDADNIGSGNDEETHQNENGEEA